MAQELNLGVARPGRMASPALTTEISRFKDDSNPVRRVVAASGQYIVYSLKNRNNLRVIVKAPETSQLGYKEHSAEVTSAQFVNVRSNVIATTSPNETLVWYVPVGKNECVTYFKFLSNVSALAWVPRLHRPPDLLVIATGKASILQAGKLILQKSGVSGNDAITGPMLTAGKADLTPLHSSVTATQPLADAASPFLAFTAGNDTVVTCMLTNTSTPPWRPCPDGESILDMTLTTADGEFCTLSVAALSGIYLWSVAGEPHPLQIVKLGMGHLCTTLKATSNRLAILSATAEGSLHAAVMKFNVDGSLGDSAAFFLLPIPRATGGMSHVPTRNSTVALTYKETEIQLCSDRGDVLHYIALSDAPWTKLLVSPETAPVSHVEPSIPLAVQPELPPTHFAPPSTFVPSKPLPLQAQPFVPTNQAPALFQQPLGVRLGGPMTTNNNQNIIRNPALPQTAAVDSTMQASISKMTGDQLDHHKTTIVNALNNAASMLGLCRTMIMQDHETLVQEALSSAFAANANELSRVFASENGASASDADQAVQKLVPEIANAVVEGVVSSIENSIKEQLTPILVAAMQKKQKEIVKAKINEKRDRMEMQLKETLKEVTETVQEKYSEYSSRLVFNVTSVSEEGSNAVASLQQIINKQDDLLQSIMKSNVLEEVKTLRQEVAALKARLEGAEPPTMVDDLSYDTVLGKACSLLAEGAHKDGLNWVFRYDDHSMVHAVFAKIDSATRDAMLDDTSLSAETWGRVVSSLMSSSKAENLDQVLPLLEVILIDKQELTANNALVKTVQDFIDMWKTHSQGSGGRLSADASGALRAINMSLRKR